MTTVKELVEKPSKPTLKLYTKDLSAVKDIDVDDTLTLKVKVKAKSKYREDYMEGEPLCITFEVNKVEEL